MLRFRKWLAHKLAGLARRIHPECPEAIAFYTDRMMDLVITGQSTIKVQAVPMTDFTAIVGDGPAIRWDPSKSAYVPYDASEVQGMKKQ